MTRPRRHQARWAWEYSQLPVSFLRTTSLQFRTAHAILEVIPPVHMPRDVYGEHPISLSTTLCGLVTLIMHSMSICFCMMVLGSLNICLLKVRTSEVHQHWAIFERHRIWNNDNTILCTFRPQECVVLITHETGRNKKHHACMMQTWISQLNNSENECAHALGLQPWSLFTDRRRKRTIKASRYFWSIPLY